ncbi:hypothetical protein WDU94_007638 [Cyamophila willieti]
MSRLRVKSVDFIKKTYSSAKDFLTSMSSSRVSQPNLNLNPEPDPDPQPSVNFDVRIEEIPFVIAPELISLCNELSAKLDNYHSATSCSHQEENSNHNSHNENEQSNSNHGVTIQLNPNKGSNIRPKSVLLSEGGSTLTLTNLKKHEEKYTQQDKDTDSDKSVQMLKDQNIRVKILKLPQNKLVEKRELSRIIPIFTIDTLTNSKIEIVSSQSSTKMVATLDNTNVKINTDGRKITQTVNISSTDIKSKNWNGTDQPEEQTETPNSSTERENKSSEDIRKVQETVEHLEREQESDNSKTFGKGLRGKNNHNTERENGSRNSKEKQHQSTKVNNKMKKLNQKSSHYKSNYYGTKQGRNVGQKRGPNDSEIIQHETKRQSQWTNQEGNKHEAKFPSIQSNLDVDKVEIIRVGPTYSSITKFNSVGSMEFTQRAVKEKTWTHTRSPERNKFGLSKTDDRLSPRVYSMRNVTFQNMIEPVQKNANKEQVTKPKKHEVEKTYRLKRGKSMLPVPLKPYKRNSESVPTGPNTKTKEPLKTIPPTPSAKLSRRVVTGETPTKSMKKPIIQSQVIRQTEVTEYMKTRASELKRQMSRNTAHRAISGRRLNEKIEGPTDISSPKEKTRTNPKEIKVENDKIKTIRSITANKKNDRNNNSIVKATTMPINHFAKGTISNVNRVEILQKTTSKNIRTPKKTQNDITINTNNINNTNIIQSEDGTEESVKVLFRNKIEHRDSLDKINATPLKPTEIKPPNTPRKLSHSRRSKLRMKKMEKINDLVKVTLVETNEKRINQIKDKEKGEKEPVQDPEENNISKM